MTSEYKYDGDTEGYWSWKPFHSGDEWWAHFVTEGWFPKGAWVTVMVGDTTWQRVTADDMKVFSVQRFKWNIEGVWVHAG